LKKELSKEEILAKSLKYSSRKDWTIIQMGKEFYLWNEEIFPIQISDSDLNSLRGNKWKEIDDLYDRLLSDRLEVRPKVKEDIFNERKKLMISIILLLLSKDVHQLEEIENFIIESVN
jgi:hypothetical protein